MLHHLRSRGSRRGAALLLAAAALGAVPAAAHADGAAPDPSARGPYGVTTLDYTLGDRAVTAPGFHAAGADGAPLRALAPLEITGDLHLPTGANLSASPVVVLLHGYWQTCADRAAGRRWTTALAAERRTQDRKRLKRLDAILQAANARLMRWPCASGTPALPSYKGLDYLADALASQGFAVVSISANGVNAGEMGDAADAARAALINRHLALLAQLATTGDGPLAGKLVDRATGRPAAVDLRGRLDLSRVGTLGHSRGGRAVMWQAADEHRGQWPAGVTVKAAFGLAPAGVADPAGPDAAHYRVTGAAIGVWDGTCDLSARSGGDYVQIATGKTTLPIFDLTVDGANHDFLNTQWSPSSGQVLAEDDAVHAGRGRCADAEAQPETGKGKIKGKPAPPARKRNLYRQLSEAGERRLAVGYVSAFFRRWLMDDHGFDAVLGGQAQPLASVGPVTARLVGP